MTHNLTVAIDVDGVISPVTAVDCDTPLTSHVDWGYRKLSGRLMNALVADEVAAMLTRLSKVATMRWHTSWRENAEPFTEELGLPHFEQFATDEEFRRNDGETDWWKLNAVMRWLRGHEGTDEHLLWMDDDIMNSHVSGEIPDWVLYHPQISIISPHVFSGLSPEHLAAIETVMAGGRIDYASNPAAPKPLPTTPGSVIVVPERPEPDWSYPLVLTAILGYDGEIVWGDSFIDGEMNTAYDTQLLASKPWVQLLTTVEASQAPESIREMFEDGEIIVGAVFATDSYDVPLKLTTAPGGLHTKSFGEGPGTMVFDEVDAIDQYGNRYEDGERTALYLPTTLS